MKFLYEAFEGSFAEAALEQVALPRCISENLKPEFGEREYQTEAFKRFVYFHENEFSEKPPAPHHVLYNMATGSGKTLIMAGLMLYLYQRGYRNFLFFVSRDNIIKKTRANFLDARSSKYLFSEKIVIDGREVFIRDVSSFDRADDDNINIKFTTIQQLHEDLNNAKENSITYEDFEQHKIVLIADEAHHNVGRTKAKEEVARQIRMHGVSVSPSDTWEDTVERLHRANPENILLEYTATIDTSTAQLVEYYRDRVIYKYDLRQFRIDRYSKEISLLRSHYAEPERILQALILNLYREVLAADNGISLKPVILFKARKTIAESKENKENFHELIDNLSAEMITSVKGTSTVKIVERAFNYFDSKGMTADEIVRRTKSNFQPENCISANDEAESDRNQIVLNTLEDGDNPVRAVFAVQKLNEGWDVLNLFDIVRLYEGQNTGGSSKGKPGKTTISEAQLIGRGARYYPFVLPNQQERYQRKFDAEVGSDLRVLEELYYHAKEEHRYISDLKAALVQSGIYEDESELETKELKLKESFKKTEFYKRGRVYYNAKRRKSDNVELLFSELGLSRKPYEYAVASGAGSETAILDDPPALVETNLTPTTWSVPIRDMFPDYAHAVRYALDSNDAFDFDRLQTYFPNLTSLDEFMQSEEYLGGCSIRFSGVAAIAQPRDYMNAVREFLQVVKDAIQGQVTEFQSTPFTTNEPIKTRFKDKEIRVRKDDERADGQEDVVADKKWYVFNANYGTSEEKAFVRLFAEMVEQDLKQRFQEIYLIRNERALKIYSQRGRAFEPDFLLFCIKNNGEQLIYQVFIEPKGDHLSHKDGWKEHFLEQIKKQQQQNPTRLGKYLITAVPEFFNSEDETRFRGLLKDALKIKQTSD